MCVGVLFCDRDHQPQVGHHEGVTGSFMLASQPPHGDQPPRQRFGALPGQPHKTSQLLAGFTPPRGVDGRGIEDL